TVATHALPLYRDNALLLIDLYDPPVSVLPDFDAAGTRLVLHDFGGLAPDRPDLLGRHPGARLAGLRPGRHSGGVGLNRFNLRRVRCRGLAGKRPERFDLAWKILIE